LGLGLWGVLVLSYRQAVTPNHLQGRVGASMRFVSYGLGALGYALAGILPTLTGLRPALWLAALGFVAILLITLLATPIPRLRSIPTSADIAAPDLGREDREAAPSRREGYLP
jgi:MFS family permease